MAEVGPENLPAHDPDVVRSVMNTEAQNKYANQMQDFWNAGGDEFKPKQIQQYSETLPESERTEFVARHNLRTEIGANSEFTGNGLTANTAEGGGDFGVVETLSLDRDLPDPASLQKDKVVKTIDLKPL